MPCPADPGIRAAAEPKPGFYGARGLEVFCFRRPGTRMSRKEVPMYIGAGALVIILVIIILILLF
jgi:hypothetical protein